MLLFVVVFFKGKNNLFNYVSLPAQRYDLKNRTVTPRNLTKNTDKNVNYRKLPVELS